ncbi:MAG: hypothetical protein NPIRA04_27050 [Nitrospirales bacterium]|nr:MAG: hypothetical protein NPIRA04_27050 [Nitrospirales bacterium]
MSNVYSSPFIQKTLVVLGLACCLFLNPTAVQSANIVQSTATDSIKVQWSANSESDLAGYRVYQGTSPGSYSIYFDVGNTTVYEPQSLEAGLTYYFAITAYDAVGNESSPSTEVSVQVLAPPLPTLSFPELMSPAPGATLSSARETFSWTANTVSVTEWWLYVGTSKGALDIYDSGYLGMTSSRTVKELPTDGATLYVRLWYKEGGRWKFIDTTYTAHTGSILPS